MSNPLKSLADYSRLLAELANRPTVVRSTLAVWSVGPQLGLAEGEVAFINDLRLRAQQRLDFEAGLIIGYGYEVDRGGERLYWYDCFPHPNDPTLASTFPHHKHIQPDPRHNRVPAPGLTFNQPNLPLVIAEIEALL